MWVTGLLFVGLGFRVLLCGLLGCCSWAWGLGFTVWVVFFALGFLWFRSCGLGWVLCFRFFCFFGVSCQAFPVCGLWFGLRGGELE